MKRLLTLAAKIKNLLNRAMGYVSIANTLLIILTFKKVYEIDISTYLIVMIGIICLLTLGIFDYKYILKYEYQHMNKENDLKKDLLELKQLIKDTMK